MHTWKSRTLLKRAALVSSLLFASAIAGCGGDDGDDVIEFLLPMRGAHEVPAVTTTGGGNALVTLFGTSALDVDSINVQFTPTGLNNADVTRAHIHVNNGIEPNGPVILTLYEVTTDGAFTGTINRTLTAANMPAGLPIAGINSFSDLVTAILEGRAYVNLHTTQNPGGELRAPFGSEFFQAVMNGANERPTPVVTAATGTASVSFNRDDTAINTGVGTTGITPANILMAHIHVGGPNDAGPPIFTLYDRATQGALTNGRFFKRVTATDLTPGGGITSFNEALQAIRAGNAYINVHTDAFPNGEIRGQLSAVP